MCKFSKAALFAFLCFSLLQACGGGSSGAPNPNATPSDGPSNPLGGIWLSLDGTASFFIAETGSFHVRLSLGESLIGIASGTGQITVSDSDDINSQFKITGIVPLSEALDEESSVDGHQEYDCSTTGTTGDDTLYLTVRCLIGDTEYEINPTLMQKLNCSSDSVCTGNSKTYDVDSSLELVSGEYGFNNPFFISQTNLNIDSIGFVNGRIQIQWDCIIGGEVNLIDAQFNLYEIEWENALCDLPYLALEQTKWQGFFYVVSSDSKAKEIHLIGQGQPRSGDLTYNLSMRFTRFP